MVETAGTQLRRARSLRQLSLEDVSRATKIRVAQLADLEGDEYSNFANLAYARSFLVGYAKFLRLDVRGHVESFADAGTFGLDDYQYLSEKPVGVFRVPTRRTRRRVRRGRLLAAGASLALLTALGAGWFAVLTYQRLGDVGKLAARQEARERALRGGLSDSTATADAAPPPSSNGPDAPAPALVPVMDPAPDAPTPAPTVPPTLPLDENLNTAIPALAVMQSAVPAAGVPALLPLPLAEGGDPGQPVLTPPPAGRTALPAGASARREEARPQRVVNRRGRE